MKSLYKPILFFIYGLSLLFSAVMFIIIFFFDAYSTDMQSQKVLFKTDNFIWTLGVAVIFFAMLFLCFILVKKYGEKFLRIQFILTIAWVFISGMAAIVLLRSNPGADAQAVYLMAESAAKGDLSFIHPTDSYLSYYPHQIGLVTFYLPFIFVWNLLKLPVEAAHTLKAVNTILLCIAVAFQYGTLKFFSRSGLHTVKSAYLLLTGLFLPLLSYTSFVYGEIPSLAFMSISMYFAVKVGHALLEKEGPVSIKDILWLILSSLVSVLIRKNSLIYIIAVCLVLLVCLFKRFDSKVLIGIILIAFGAAFGSKGMCLVYEGMAGAKLPSGVTALSYFAMGMQESDRGNGWYNGFNFNTYMEAGLDSTKANEISKKAIGERMTVFKENTGYAWDFYFKKYLSQWADGTYSVRQATYPSYSRSAFFWDFYTGDRSMIVIGFCNALQTLMFLGLFVYSLFSVIKKEQNLVLFIPLITLFGTFLFHMLWEANSRYSFPTVGLVLPVMAVGLSKLFGLWFKE